MAKRKRNGKDMLDVLDYALCFLLANFDDDNEEDLGITEAELSKKIIQWKKENGMESK